MSDENAWMCRNFSSLRKRTARVFVISKSTFNSSAPAKNVAMSFDEIWKMVLVSFESRAPKSAPARVTASATRPLSIRSAISLSERSDLMLLTISRKARWIRASADERSASILAA